MHLGATLDMSPEVASAHNLPKMSSYRGATTPSPPLVLQPTGTPHQELAAGSSSDEFENQVSASIWVLN